MSAFDSYSDRPAVGDTIRSAFNQHDGLIARADDQLIVIRWPQATDALRPDQFHAWAERISATAWRID